jgi:hypothetical protein
MKCSAGAGFITALGLAFVVSPLGAQDLDQMVKWTAAEVIHYDVVAEYSGQTRILVGDSGRVTGYSTQVKDRYEIGFDWNPTEMAMVGKPVFKNFPATLPNGTPAGTMFGQSCPQPKMNGSYDHVEVLGAKTGLLGSNSLELSVRRTYPAGSIPYAAEGPCTNWAEAPKKTETATDGVLVPPGLYLAMPTAAGANITFGKDGKTMILQDTPNGWTYTYTLRIVK